MNSTGGVSLVFEFPYTLFDFVKSILIFPKGHWKNQKNNPTYSQASHFGAESFCTLLRKCMITDGSPCKWFSGGKIFPPENHKKTSTLLFLGHLLVSETHL